jgi:hypothetical protein
MKPLIARESERDGLGAPRRSEWPSSRENGRIPSVPSSLDAKALFRPILAILLDRSPPDRYISRMAFPGSIRLDISVAEAVAAYRILVSRRYIDDEGESGLFRKLEAALHGTLSIEDMEKLAEGGENAGR